MLGPFAITVAGVEYAGAVLHVGQYRTRELALQLWDDEGPITTATVSLPNTPAEPGFCWVRDWNENAGILDEFERLGWLRRTGRVQSTGYVTAMEAEVIGDLRLEIGS